MYKKIRYAFRFSQAVIIKYKFHFLAVIAFGALLYFSIPYFYTRLPRIRSTKRVAIVGKYTLSTLPVSIQQQLSVGLTSLDSTGLPYPAIAESWIATDSGKTYIFNLNTSLRWQDRTALKSKDIQLHFRDAQVDYPSDDQLIIRLRDPYSPLPVLVSQPVLKVITSRNIFRTSTLLGLGSYSIGDFKKNGDILDSLSLTPVKKELRLPFLQYYFYPTSLQAKTAFKLGLVETVEDLQSLDELANWPNTLVTPQVHYDRHVAVFFNTQDPLLTGITGKNLRLALSYAIDKTRWEDRAYSPLPPTSWAYNVDIRKYDQDLEKSLSLIKKVEKLPDPLTLTTVPSYLEIAESIKKDWEKVGIHTEIRVVPDIPSEFQVLLIAQSIPSDPDQYNLWHSTKVNTNLTQLKNPRIDKLLEDGRKSSILEERKLIYQDFQKYLLEESPAIFLFYPKTYTISRQ